MKYTKLAAALLLLVTSASAQIKARQLEEAIAKAEGFYQKGTVPNRCHNPGDLKANVRERYLGQTGFCKAGSKTVRFKNDAAGWLALEQQIEKIARGESKHYNVNMTLQQVAHKYAGNWQVWSNNVAHNLNTTPKATLSEVLELPPTVTIEWHGLVLVSKTAEMLSME